MLYLLIRSQKTKQFSKGYKMQQESTIRVYNVETGEITKTITLTSTLGEFDDDGLHQHRVEKYMEDVLSYETDDSQNWTTLSLDNCVDQYETTNTKYVEIEL
jgi:hypothetical protein